MYVYMYISKYVNMDIQKRNILRLTPKQHHWDAGLMQVALQGIQQTWHQLSVSGTMENGWDVSTRGWVVGGSDSEVLCVCVCVVLFL